MIYFKPSENSKIYLEWKCLKSVSPIINERHLKIRIYKAPIMVAKKEEVETIGESDIKY